MRGFLILFAVLLLVITMMPFIMGFVVFVLLFAAIFMLLARLGLLPGATFKTYTYTSSSRKRPGEDVQKTRKTIYFEGDEVPPKGDADGWYQSAQEGEIITLPETALKKDDGAPPSSQ